MVKGVSRQVIVVQSPDPKLFEQAIFILRDDVVGKEGITDEALLKEARLASCGRKIHKTHPAAGLVWSFGGAAATALVWLLTTLLG